MSAVRLSVRLADLRKHLTTRKQRRRAWFYIFVAPWLLGFVLLRVVPLTLGFLTSLTNYDGLNLASLRFVGLDNYARALTRDPDAIFAFGQTLK